MKPLWENVNDVSRLLRTIDKPAPCGALADTDIWDAIYRGEIYISPFRSENLTAAGYNLQVSDIIISTRSGLPLKIYTSGQYRYVDVPANDTVLKHICGAADHGNLPLTGFHRVTRLWAYIHNA